MRQGRYLLWDFLDAVGQMRVLCGVYLAMIATRYGFDVRGDLRDILPPKGMPDDLDERRGHR